MTKTILNTLTALAAAAALTAGLAACAPTADETPVVKPKPAATKPAAEQIDPMDLDGNGSVSEYEKQIAAQTAVRDYTLPDGTVVAVDPTQPLPDAVKAAVKAETASPIDAARTSSDRGQAEVALIGELDEKAAATGRGIAVVFQTPSSFGPMWVILASGQTQAPFFGSADKASVVAQAEAWTDARDYELIVY